ncbi:hypothetical protein BS47DRAFT_1342995 [Hydnum rufescens UP504]|uniref:WD40 repeat-like protein n=1 Tax=Hydnum rufescens UP504 TaxID=1448309 RepID=A0A9P6DX45_9AGAM|nr:hypothetical protein BS47DRAFT_1342995 [Hydnum rufescens UP504]
MASRAKKGSRKSKGGTLSEAPTESASWSLSSFSSDSSFFVHISLALDKHRLRLYNTATGRALAEHVFESGRVTAISWHLSPTTAATVSLEPSSKRRRKQKNLEADATSAPISTASPPVTLLAIGLSNGSISLFSPTQGRLTNTLSHPNSTSRILSLSSSPSEQGILWASNAQGALLAWDVLSNTLSRTLKPTLSSSNSTSPCTAIAVRPSLHFNAPDNLSKANVRILTAHHTIRLVTPSSSTPGVDGPGGDVREIASFTGHASPSSKDAFVSVAEGDRFVSIWGVPSSSEEDDQEEELHEGSIMASIPLDTAVRSVSFSRPPLAHSSSSSTSATVASVSPSSSLLAISVSGTLHIFPFPIPSKKSASSSKVPTAATEPSTKTIIRTPPDGAKIISATFIDLIDGDEASGGRGRAVKIARLASGVKPIFDIVKYLDQNGAYIPEIKLKSPPSNDAGADADSAIQIKRYREGQALNVRSGHELPEGVGADERMQYGELDAELAELSLGQRLAVPAPTIKDDDPVSGRRGGSSSNTDDHRCDLPHTHAHPGASLFRYTTP